MSALSPIFTKYHGNGNDFVIFDMTKPENAMLRQDLTTAASRLCRRHTGIGADGVILLDYEQNQFLMTVINADGSVAKNCGNGLRCAASYIFQKTKASTCVIKLFGKIFHCEKSFDDIFVLMGDCHVGKPQSIYLEHASCGALFSCVDVGNRHAVFFVDRQIDISHSLVDEVLSTSTVKKDVNIGFLYKDAAGKYVSKVFEAGVGFTNSCGSGACAAACFLAFLDEDFLSKEIIIKQPGGDVNVVVKDKMISSDGASFFVSQRGSAVLVFSGIAQGALLREVVIND